MSNFFATEPQVALAERLLDLLGVGPGGGKVFFANSGSEANEAAFKLTRRTGRNTGFTSRIGVPSMASMFDTLKRSGSSISAMWTRWIPIGLGRSRMTTVRSST